MGQKYMSEVNRFWNKTHQVPTETGHLSHRLGISPPIVSNSDVTHPKPLVDGPKFRPERCMVERWTHCDPLTKLDSSETKGQTFYTYGRGFSIST